MYDWGIGYEEEEDESGSLLFSCLFVCLFVCLEAALLFVCVCDHDWGPLSFRSIWVVFVVEGMIVLILLGMIPFCLDAYELMKKCLPSAPVLSFFFDWFRPDVWKGEWDGCRRCF